jgi:hypothetical protein
LFSCSTTFRCARVVIPISVIEKIRFIILIFGGEPEEIGLGHGAGGAEDFPEGAIFFMPELPN